MAPLLIITNHITMRKNIAIIAGGYSSESAVAERSAKGLYEYIDKAIYQPYVVIIGKEEWSVALPSGEQRPIDRNDFSFTQGDETIHFDFAYITIHGAPGENGQLQGYFDMLRLPYSCCDTLAAALTFNKYACNRYLSSFGVTTARSLRLTDRNTDTGQILNQLTLPLFVKPNDGGSSFATTKVKEAADLAPAIAQAFAEGKEVIVEELITGREITCGCYKTSTATLLPITEVVTHNEFFDYDAKYNGNVEEITPARLTDELTTAVQSLTSQIYDWVGAKGIIRVDYFIRPDDTICLLEVNTTPGMTPTSFIPQQVTAAGLTMTQVMTEIIEHELSKH